MRPEKCRVSWWQGQSVAFHRPSRSGCGECEELSRQGYRRVSRARSVSPWRGLASGGWLAPRSRTRRGCYQGAPGPCGSSRRQFVVLPPDSRCPCIAPGVTGGQGRVPTGNWTPAGASSARAGTDSPARVRGGRRCQAGNSVICSGAGRRRKRRPYALAFRRMFSLRP